MPDDPKRGLYGKYRVERVDGKPIKGDRCIVLELGDPNAWPALIAWADTVRGAGYYELAEDVRALVRKAQGIDGREDAVGAQRDASAGGAP